MGLLDIAGRMLVQKGTEKFLKETSVGKKIVKAITPKNKPQTPQGEGLSFGGNTLQPSAQYQRSAEENMKAAQDIEVVKNYVGKDNQEISKAAQDYSTPEFNIDDFFNKSSEFMNFGMDSKKSGEFRDAVVKTTKGDPDASKLISSKVSTKSFEDFKFFRRRVDEDKSGMAGTKEGIIEGIYSGQGGNVPFVGDTVTEFISKGIAEIGAFGGGERFPSFREHEQAKSELEAEGQYKKNMVGRFGGAVQVGLTGYSGVSKIVDKALLATRVPKFIQPLQETLKQSYVNNPIIFNLTSNSAQEAIEYGVRKGIGDEDYSVKDFVMGLGLGAVASAFGKSANTIFDRMTQKDLNKIESAMSEVKKINPDISPRELIDSAASTKLDSGMTLGDLKKTFIQGNKGKFSESLDTTSDAISDFFRGSGVNVTSGAAKKVSSFLNDINLKIKGIKPEATTDEMLNLTGKGDLNQMKQDIISDLMSKGQLSTKDVEETFTKFSELHGLPIHSKANIDILDEAEDIFIKGYDISDLANPQSFNNYRKLYAGIDNYDDTKLNKLQDELDLLNGTKGRNNSQELSRLTKIREKTGAISKELEALGVKNVDEFIKKRYQIPDELINQTAKLARKTGTKGRLTNIEKNYALATLRNDAIKAEESTEKAIKKLDKFASVDSDSAYSKVVTLAQLNKNLATTTDYAGTLRAFNKEVDEMLKTGEGFINVKEARAARVSADIDMVMGEAKANQNGVFEYAMDEQPANLSKIGKVGRGITKVYKNITGGNGGIANFFDNRGRVFDKMMGSSSAAKRVLHGDIMKSEGEFRGVKNAFIGGANDTLRATPLNPKDMQQKLRFSIYLYERAGLANRVSGRMEGNTYRGPENLWINDKGELLYKAAKDTVATKGFRRILEEDVPNLTKEFKNGKYDKFTQYLDNNFTDSAVRINKEISQASGKLIDSQKIYFPTNYPRSSSHTYGEESVDSLKQMYTKNVDQGFLNARLLEPPASFDIELDLQNILNKYADRQLYFIHMKDSIMRAKRVATGANIRSASDDAKNADDFIMKEDGSVEFNDIDMNTTKSRIFSQEAQRYFSEFIDDVSTHGMIGKMSKTTFGKTYTSLSTFLSLSANIMVALAQPISKIDSSANTTFKNWGKSAITGMMDTFRKGEDIDAIKLSGVLQTRQTEKKIGTAQGGKIPVISWFQQKDIADFNLKRFRDAPISEFNERFMRLTKRVDGEISNSVWQGYFFDYADKYAPHAKGWSVGDIASKMNKEQLNAARRYADENMVNVMGGTDLVSMGSRAAYKWGDMYAVGTAVQKTFINRFLFYNDVLEKGGFKSVPKVLIALGLSEWAEYEREYARVKLNEYTGKSEFKETGSHIGNIIANNPSLKWDATTIKYVKATFPNLPEDKIAGILGAKLFLNMMSNAVVNPASTYSITTGVENVKKVVDTALLKDEYPVKERFYIKLSEEIAKMILPGQFDELVPALHNTLLNEPMWKTEDDNYQLGKITKGKPELSEELSSQSFKAQGDYAKNDRKVYEAGGEIRKEKEKVKATMNETAKSILAEKQVEKMDEESFINYVVDNPSIIDGMSDGDIEELQKILSTGKPDVRTDKYAPYRKTTTDTEVIYKDFLKEYVDKGDMDGLESMMDELEAQEVIKSREGFEKRMLKIIEKDNK